MWFPIITLLSYYYDEWRSKIYLSDAVVVTEVVTRIMIDRLIPVVVGSIPVVFYSTYHQPVSQF
jgi:Na+/H+ antiporter NhaB